MKAKAKRAREPRSLDIQAAEQVVRHVAVLIERGQLHPGDRLPAERELAQDLGVSRPTIRAGLQTLAAMGVTASRRGRAPSSPPARRASGRAR